MANDPALVDEIKAALAPDGDPNAVCGPNGERPLHWLLDWHYDRAAVETLLDRGADPDAAHGPFGETALHVATRRRRADAVERLLDRGVAIDAKTLGGKTAWCHAARRGFADITAILERRGADTTLNDADRLAVALCANDLDAARRVIAENPAAATSPNPEEARILPDLAGRDAVAAVRLLLDAGTPIDARALDGGTALNQAAWFGQPEVAQLLIQRGAPIDVSGDDYDSTPLGWVSHGSQYSGGAAERQDVYLRIAALLLDAGASLAAPPDHPGGDPHGGWLLADASPALATLLKSRGARAD